MFCRYGQQADICLIHLDCGDVAFYYDHTPTAGEILDTKSATLLDGTKPASGDKVICGSCEREVSLSDLIFRSN